MTSQGRPFRTVSLCTLPFRNPTTPDGVAANSEESEFTRRPWTGPSHQPEGGQRNPTPPASADFAAHAAQLGSQLRGTLVAFLRFLPESLCDHPFQPRRHSRIQLACRSGLPAQNGITDLPGRLSRKGRSPSGHFVEHRAKAEE